MSTALEIHSQAHEPSHGAVLLLSDSEAKLASITSVEEGQRCRAEIAAIHRFLKYCRAGLANQNKAALLKFRVERRIGKVLLGVPKVQGKRDGGDGLVMTFKRSRISPQTGYRWMALGRIPEEELVRWAALCDAHGDELTSTLVYDALVRQYYERDQSPSEDFRSRPPYLIKRELIEWGIMDEADLAGLPAEAEVAVVTEVRSAYEDYLSGSGSGQRCAGKVDGIQSSSSTGLAFGR